MSTFLKVLFSLLVFFALLAGLAYIFLGKSIQLVSGQIGNLGEEQITVSPITVSDLSKTMKIKVLTTYKEIIVDKEKKYVYKIPEIKVFNYTFGNIVLKENHYRLCAIFLCRADLGYDLSKVSPDWLTVRGDTAIVKMPPVELLNKGKWTVDETNKRTRTIIEDRGAKWTKEEKRILKLKANVKMRNSLVTEGIYKSANHQGKEIIANLIRSYGYKVVIVH